MQPCAYGEPFGLVLIAGSWRGKLTSLPLGLFQLISFFFWQTRPLSVWFSYNERLPGSGYF